jgi:hypothetical protein
VLLALAVAVSCIATSAAEDAPLSLQAPPDRAVITFPEPASGTVALTWREVAGASEYRVTVATKADLSRPIVQRATSDLSVSVRGFREGKYFWRVEAAGKTGTIAARSEVRSFSIRPGNP